MSNAKILFHDVGDLDDPLYFGDTPVKVIDKVLDKAKTEKGAFISPDSTRHGDGDCYIDFLKLSFWKNFIAHLTRIHGEHVLFLVPTKTPEVRFDVNLFFTEVNGVLRTMLEPEQFPYKKIIYQHFDNIADANDHIRAKNCIAVFFITNDPVDLSEVYGAHFVFSILDALQY